MRPAKSMIKFAQCDDCPLRGSTVVPGRGPGAGGLAKIIVVGEAPGREEEARGRPFVGRAGSLLRELASRVGWDLSVVHMTNACLCRPPRNREPTAEEIRACWPRLEAEVGIVDPEIVVTLGNASTTAFIGHGRGITKRRGVFRQVVVGGRERWVLPTIHPAALLRDPGYARDVIFDLKRAWDVLAGKAPAAVQPPYENYAHVTPGELLEGIEAADIVALDIETTGLDSRTDRITTLGVSWARGQAVVVEWEDMRPEHVRRLDELLRQRRCVFHNASFDVEFLNAYGVHPNLWFDTMLANYCLDERQGAHSLKRLAAERYFWIDYEFDTLGRSGFEDTDVSKAKALATRPREDVYKYNCADADVTFRLAEDLLREMEAEGVRSVHDGILIPAVRHFIEFTRTGMLVDRDHLEELGAKWRAEMREIEEFAREVTGRSDLNLNSPKQLAEVLYDDLGLEPIPGRDPNSLTQAEILRAISGVQDEEAVEFWRTASSFTYRNMGSRSTSAFMLYYLAQQHELPRRLVTYRLISKRYGSYYQGILKRLGDDGRLRPRYRLHGTVTGRLSSSDPNIHGIPREAEIRNIFIAEPGMVMLSADYAQAEIRMAAALSKDEQLIELLRSEDIHAEIAKLIFRMSDADLAALDTDTKGARRRAAKTIAFGLIYGRSAASIATQLGVSRAEAEQFVAEFFNRMPKLRAYINRQRTEVTKSFEVKSIYGRRRRFYLVANKKQREEMQRQAVNMPIQSAVSDLTLLANLESIRRLRAAGIRTLPGPHIHDGFLLQVAEDRADEAAKIVEEAMREDEGKLGVPLLVDVKLGKRWGELG